MSALGWIHGAAPLAAFASPTHLPHPEEQEQQEQQQATAAAPPGAAK